MNIYNGYTYEITPEQKHQNEIAAVKSILADDPENEYWQNRLSIIQPCLHPKDKIILEQSGGLRCVDGEVIDTRREHLLCTACGETLPEVGSKEWFDAIPEEEF